MVEDVTRIKVMVMGEGAVGKSSICQKLFQGQTYNPQNDPGLYRPTIASDFFTKSFQIGEGKLL